MNNNLVLIFRNIIIALLYFITGKISFMLFTQDAIVTLNIFIPEGIALACVLIYGPKIIPGIFLGQFLLAINVSLFASIGIAISNSLEAFIAYKLFNYFRLNKELISIRDYIGLLLLIILILQPFSAIFGNLVLLIGGISSVKNIFQDIFFWWFSNSLGQLFMTPMILLYYFNRSKFDIFKIIKNISIILFFGILNYILQVKLGINNVALLLALTLPITIYLSTINICCATLAVLSLVLTTLYFFHMNEGSFVGNTKVNDIININFFILNHIILVPLIGILFREKNEALQALSQMAKRDHLTGVKNRNALDEEIDKCVYLAKKFNQNGLVCYIDLDNFKSVNDNYGHDIGDKLLKEVTKRISENIRVTDTLIRLGGDEFLLILNNIEQYEANNLLNRIMKTINSIEYIDNNKIDISVSIGVASCLKDGETSKELLQKADEAMYKIKKSTKNGIAFSENCV